MIEGKTKEALKVAAQLLVDNGLGDWHFNIKDVTSFHAQTRYKQKMITYGSRFIRVATKEQFIGVTYHEIAHALVGGGQGHNVVFKRKYHELTGNYDFAGYATAANTKDYLTECDACGSIATVNNTRKRWCKPCWTNHRKMQVLTITPNPLLLVNWAKS